MQHEKLFLVAHSARLFLLSSIFIILVIHDFHDILSLPYETSVIPVQWKFSFENFRLEIAICLRVAVAAPLRQFSTMFKSAGLAGMETVIFFSMKVLYDTLCGTQLHSPVE